MASSSASATAPPEVVLPPGVVFEPSDEQLVFDYLIPMVSHRAQGKGFGFIKELDIYKHKPSELSRLAVDSKDKNMYFFAPVHKKGQKQEGKNAARQGPDGHWKKTGEISDIKGKDGKPIAKKTSLAYYYKKDETSESVKGEWLMKEYMLLETEQPKMENPLALCVVYHKPSSKRKNRN